ncbi:helix-turn-helix transcriptional regulator [Pseudemcibacter aquimaris]|uniref:helix-turn-helix transcriptional regulator n=1 Tax=Pseudemcibacter aquimaris TaxID=2857064 RepID=UPI002011B1E5|nr:YafY family protein [Pseudemcibacter aquimaris]MCC3859967.1 YafY family transcriptional regulator [Pseudemcibacter aquimaris]WDU57299.1 YafY family transcriptional regulator [Pseudemcibacter aquimaris]
MRRSDRLFQIIQILRRATRHPITAHELAEELETSVRTVYRDIADLMAQRVPIRGEAGMGYVLESGYDMPPLMLTSEEIEAALLGAQWVANQGDAALAGAAKDLISKIGAVIPEEMQTVILEPITMAPGWSNKKSDNIDMKQLRFAIRNRHKLKLDYRDEHDNPSSRVIWPIAVAYFETVRLIVAWCEKREDFRHFRTDRIKEWELQDDLFPGPLARLRNEWWEQQKCEQAP